MGLTYRICSSNFVAISIFMNLTKKKIAFFLEFVYLHKKNNIPLLLLLNICKFSIFIHYRPMIVGGSMSPSFNHSTYKVVNVREAFGHNPSRS